MALQLQIVEDRARAAEEEVSRRKAEAAAAVELQRALERSIAAAENRGEERLRDAQHRHEAEIHALKMEIRKLQEQVNDKESGLRTSETVTSDLRRKLVSKAKQQPYRLPALPQLAAARAGNPSP